VGVAPTTTLRFQCRIYHYGAKCIAFPATGPGGAKVRTGGVEPPQPVATGLQPAELADAQRPHEYGGVAGRTRTDTAGFTAPDACRYTTATTNVLHVANRTRTGTSGEPSPLSARPCSACSLLHHSHMSGDGRTRTGGQPADNRLLWPLSYAPEKEMEGGIGSPQPEAETSPSRRYLRSQLLPIGTPASACPRRHLLTGRPWRLAKPAAR
jgi:hypothetical protein